MMANTFVCIASGPSLTSDDCETVRRLGLPTIAVNTSHKAAPFAQIIYAGDAVWWDANHHEVPATAEKWTSSANAAMRYNLRHHNAPSRINSGAKAIQLAILKGAKTIYLLGYDCSLEHGTHWHGDHTKTLNPKEHQLTEWQTDFTNTATMARAHGVKICNLSRHTALTCFERRDLESLL